MVSAVGGPTGSGTAAAMTGVAIPGYQRLAGSYRFVNQRLPFLVAQVAR